MNLFDKNIFQKYDNCYFFYNMSVADHSESVYLEFEHLDEYGEIDAEKRYVITANAPLFSNWLKLFGYDANEEEILQVMSELKKIFKIIPIKRYKTQEGIQTYLKTLSKDIVQEQTDRIWELLAPIIKIYPLTARIYMSCYDILSNLHYYLCHPKESQNISQSLALEFMNLSEELTKQEKVYYTTREYCKAIFMTDNAAGSIMSPQERTYLYREYCYETASVDYSLHPILKSSAKPTTFRKMEGKPLKISWEEYYDLSKKDPTFSDCDAIGPQMFTIEDIAYAGIFFLTKTDSVLRTCKLCGKEFRVKYTSPQEYCTRPYGSTTTPCNEYASRKNYKEKLLKHPIHQEFTKAYNNLYARIRRGKLPADTPLMDQLKRLHEDYYERYENTHLKEREAVWKEYIEKNKDLLK